MELNFKDFQKQDIKFDIVELKKAYKQILKIKDFRLFKLLIIKFVYYKLS